jgi:hypothetical protein
LWSFAISRPFCGDILHRLLLLKYGGPRIKSEIKKERSLTGVDNVIW